MTVFNRSMFRGGDAVQRDLHRLLGGGIGGLDPMAGAYDFLPRGTSSLENILYRGPEAMRQRGMNQLRFLSHQLPDRPPSRTLDTPVPLGAYDFLPGKTSVFDDLLFEESGVGIPRAGTQPSPVSLQEPDRPISPESVIPPSSLTARGLPQLPSDLLYSSGLDKLPGFPETPKLGEEDPHYTTLAPLVSPEIMPWRAREILDSRSDDLGSFGPEALDEALQEAARARAEEASKDSTAPIVPSIDPSSFSGEVAAELAAAAEADAEAEEMRRLEQASHAAASAAEARENLESVKEEFLQTGLSSEKLERISKIRPGPRPDQPEAPKTLKQRITDNVNIMKEIFGVSNRDQAIERAMDMAYIGFAIASGQSPNFLTNVAQGLMAGTESIRERMGEDKEFDQRLTLAAYEQTLSEDAAAAERVAARDLKELELRLAAVKANETREQNRLDDVLELVQKTVLDAPEDYAKLLEGEGGGTLLLDPEDDESIMSLEEFTKRREEEVLETAAETYGIVGGGISEKVQVLRRGRQVAEELEELKRTLGALMIPADVTDEKTSDAIATRRLEVEKRIRELNKEMLELNNRLAPTSASPRG